VPVGGIVGGTLAGALVVGCIIAFVWYKTRNAQDVSSARLNNDEMPSPAPEYKSSRNFQNVP
jgi:hypothetical protein